MRSTISPARPFPSVPGAALALWLLVAVAIGATGALARLPVPPPAIALGLAAALAASLGASPRLRGWVRGLGAAPLVGFHLLRIPAGGWFLVLWGRGVLPGGFALSAGVGDVLVGVGAAWVLRCCLPARTAARRRGLLAWNALGLLDILLVLGNGMRTLAADPAAGAAFARLPLALLPTFVVPLVLASHVLLFAMARAAGREAGAPPPP